MLGCYTLMKNTLVIAFSLLVLCGCSKHHEIPARNLVVAGKDTAWHGRENENYVLYVAKRDGDSLEGIHIVFRGHPGGPPATITADKGRIMQTSDPVPSNGVTYTNTVTIDLDNWRFQTDKTDQTEQTNEDFIITLRQ